MIIPLIFIPESVVAQFGGHNRSVPEQQNTNICVLAQCITEKIIIQLLLSSTSPFGSQQTWNNNIDRSPPRPYVISISMQ